VKENPDGDGLAQARAEIDRINDELVRLFVRRLDLSSKIASAKRAAGKPVTDPQREREILSRVGASVPPEYESAARLLFSTLFSVSKARQRELMRAADAEVPPKWRVAVVGMGLIGGSFEKAAAKAGYAVRALHHGDATGFEDADLILVCLPPDAVVPWVEAHCGGFRKGATVVDIAGVKTSVMEGMGRVPRDGWTFVGGHPMAGREVTGYENSLADLFVGASMILVPEAGDRAAEGGVMSRLEAFFRSVGFERVVVTTAAEHDEMIAFTSQLCHAMATAYARDGLVPGTPGFSAGSFADMTRIATQDPAIWTELFLANRGPLLSVVDRFASRIGEFRSALEACDRDAVSRMISEGAEAKRRLNLAADFWYN